MCAIVLPGQANPPGQIELQTRKGSDIENIQAWELTRLNWKEIESLVEKYASQYGAAFVTFLTGLCPVYNCHGLCLASRRTQLSPETADFSAVIKEDGYSPVNENDVQPGDLVLYHDKTDGSIVHSGIVMRVEEPKGLTVRIPWIWSKWGHGHEVLHNCNCSPYSPANLRYYRMRSWEPPPPL
jgi:hypothetical protein